MIPVGSETPVYDQLLRELVGFPAWQLAEANKGIEYMWHGVQVTVTRVAGDRSWVDLQCVQGADTWTRRLLLSTADTKPDAPPDEAA